MKLLDTETGKFLEAEIETIPESDIPAIRKQFSFDWEKEKPFEAFKIVLTENREIVGLLSWKDIPEELRIEIRLLELAKENVGKNKRIDNIAGCLIAHACKESFLKGYGGFVSLKPKTRLIEHYRKKYGFVPFGQQLAVHSTISKALVNQYLES